MDRNQIKRMVMAKSDIKKVESMLEDMERAYNSGETELADIIYEDAGFYIRMLKDMVCGALNSYKRNGEKSGYTDFQNELIGKLNKKTDELTMYLEDERKLEDERRTFKVLSYRKTLELMDAAAAILVRNSIEK